MCDFHFLCRVSLLSSDCFGFDTVDIQWYTPAKKHQNSKLINADSFQFLSSLTLNNGIHNVYDMLLSSRKSDHITTHSELN